MRRNKDLDQGEYQVIRKSSPFVIVLGLYLIWEFTPLGSVPATFIKKDGFVDRYELFYFPSLLVLTLVAQSAVDRMSFIRCISVAVLAGHLVSLFSIIGTWFIDVDKLTDAFFWNKRHFGFFDTLFFYLAIPIPTLGWLITPIAFFLLKIKPMEKLRTK